MKKYGHVLLFGVLAAYVVIHIGPYFVTPYLFPDSNVFIKSRVIQYIEAPNQYPDDAPNTRQANSHRTASPLYYLLLSYTSSITPPETVPYLLGGFLTLGVFFAFYTSRLYKYSGLAGLVAVVILLHLPRFGTIAVMQRSFLIPFLLFYLVFLFSNSNRQLLAEVGLIIIATYLYAPAALLIAGAASFYYLYKMNLFNSTITAFAYCMAQLPYLFLLYMGKTAAPSLFVWPKVVKTGSIAGFINTILYNKAPEYAGVIFLGETFFYSTAALFLILVAAYLYNKDAFTFTARQKSLLVSGAFLWGVSHLFYPILHKPTRYLGPAVLAILIIKTARHLLDAMKTIRLISTNYMVPVLLLGLAAVTTYYYSPDGMRYVVTGAGIYLFGAVIVAYSSRNDVAADYTLAVFVLSVLFCLHPLGHLKNKIHHRPAREYSAFINKVDTSINKYETVIGPIYLLNTATAITNTIPFFTPTTVQGPDCAVFDDFLDIYYTNDSKKALRFFETADFDYLIIDRILYTPNYLYEIRQQQHYQKYPNAPCRKDSSRINNTTPPFVLDGIVNKSNYANNRLTLISKKKLLDTLRGMVNND